MTGPPVSAIYVSLTRGLQSMGKVDREAIQITSGCWSTILCSGSMIHLSNSTNATVRAHMIQAFTQT